LRTDWNWWNFNRLLQSHFRDSREVKFGHALYTDTSYRWSAIGCICIIRWLGMHSNKYIASLTIILRLHVVGDSRKIHAGAKNGVNGDVRASGENLAVISETIDQLTLLKFPLGLLFPLIRSLVPSWRPSWLAITLTKYSITVGHYRSRCAIINRIYDGTEYGVVFTEI
jgi:hypothetical protein